MPNKHHPLSGEVRDSGMEGVGIHIFASELRLILCLKTVLIKH